MTASPKASRPRPGTEVELVAGPLAHGGAAVCRLDGFVVFAQGAVPGDRVRATLGKVKRSHAEARVTEVLEPGPDRIDPVASHPGAPWQVLRYEAQLAAKQDAVEQAIKRLGGFDSVQIDEIVPAEQQWRYRNKLEFSFGADDSGELTCGFHAPGRWDVVESLDTCLLGSERMDQAREAALAWCREKGLEAYDRRETVGYLRNLVVREGLRTGEIQVRLVTSTGELDDAEGFAAAVGADGVFHTMIEGVGETTQGGFTELISGSAHLHEEISGLTVSISPEAFFQTNTAMAERLYGIAAEEAALRGHERVFDLCSGIGTIGLALSPRAGEVWGLEIVEPAVADAIANAEANGIRNASFFAGDVRRDLRELVEKSGKPDVIVVDPPRAGLSGKIVRRIAEAGAKRIVYVSCNPTTLAPNAAALAELGYDLLKVRPVDLFPQTPHVECVALLERRG
ncbi:MAG: 23S rRNA (uracil(1939)-C(5))-methyltransferase RlmD [Actinomycetes bacterium]